MMLRQNIRALSICCAIIASLQFMFFAPPVQNKVSAPNQNNTGKQTGSLQCEWAFVGASPAKQGWTIFPITKDTALTSGDNLLVYFDPQTDCYVYVFLYDSDGKVQLLFPQNEKAFGVPLKKTERYIIPQKGSGMELDESKGSETFYVLISVSRLPDIELSYMKTQLPAMANTKNNAKAFLSALRGLMKKSAGSLASVADVPPSIAGTFRGPDLKSHLKDIDFEKYAVQVPAKQLYIKKIVIQHR